MRDLELVGLTVSRNTLEDVYLRLTAEHDQDQATEDAT